METAVKTIWVKGEDIHMLDDIIAQEGWSPISESAIAQVAIDEKGIAGFHILQVKSHPEPLFVRPDLRGTSLAVELATNMKAFLDTMGITNFIVVADDPAMARLCEKFGMRLVTSPVYVK